MLTIYGIKNCDTIKKTKKYFDEKAVAYQFHDYRTDGIEKAWLQEVFNNLEWDKVLNKRGTTWRQLPEQQKAQVNQDNVIDLLLEHPAMIKRPIIATNNPDQPHFLLGFSAKQLDEMFA